MSGVTDVVSPSSFSARSSAAGPTALGRDPSPAVRPRRPDTFDVEGYLATLDRVRAGGEVLAPVYRRDLVMVEVAQEEVIRRLVARHEAFGRSRAEAAHWVRVVDVPNAELVAATSARCDELWRVG